MLGSYRGFGAASEPLDLGNLRSSCPPEESPSGNRPNAQRMVERPAWVCEESKIRASYGP